MGRAQQRSVSRWWVATPRGRSRVRERGATAASSPARLGTARLYDPRGADAPRHVRRKRKFRGRPKCRHGRKRGAIDASSPAHLGAGRSRDPRGADAPGHFRRWRKSQGRPARRRVGKLGAPGALSPAGPVVSAEQTHQDSFDDRGNSSGVAPPEGEARPCGPPVRAEQGRDPGLASAQARAWQISASREWWQAAGWQPEPMESGGTAKARRPCDRETSRRRAVRRECGRHVHSTRGRAGCAPRRKANETLWASAHRWRPGGPGHQGIWR